MLNFNENLFQRQPREIERKASGWTYVKTKLFYYDDIINTATP